MSLIILDASTRAAVAAATNQEAQRAALLAPWAGGDVTVRTFNGATLRDVGTYEPWLLIASASRSAQLGNLIARTGSSTGPATLAVFQAGGTDIFSLSLATSPATADIVLPALSGGIMATARTNFSDPGVGRVTISADPSLPVTGGPAPSLTWTGPSTGTVGVPSANFTATLLNGTVPVVVTPSSVPSGTWAPTSRTLTPGGSPSGTFTLTALSAAVHAASLANDTGIAAPPAVSYTASAAAPPPAPVPTGNIVQYLTSDGGTAASGTAGNFSGPTREMWHKRLAIPWARTNTMGNWLDAAQVAEGSTAYGSSAPLTAVDQVASVNVTTLVQRWRTNGLNRGFYLRNRTTTSAFPVQFYGRLDATPANRPQLTVVASGGTVTLTAAANACWNVSSFGGSPSGAAWLLYAGAGPAILRFDLSSVSGTVTSATLTFKVKAFPSGGSTGQIVDVLEADPPTMVLPEGVASPVLGLAAEYSDFNDMKAALGTDSRLIFVDDFATPGPFDTTFSPAATRVLDTETNTTYARGTISAGANGSADTKLKTSLGTGPQGTPNVVYDVMCSQYWLHLESSFGTTQDDAIKIPAMGVQWGYWNPAGGGYWQQTTGNGGFPGTGLKVDRGSGLNFEYQGHSARFLTGTEPGAGDDDPYAGYFQIGEYTYHLDQVGPNPAGSRFGGNVVIRKGVTYCLDIRVQQNTMSGSTDSLGNYATANLDGRMQAWINGYPALDITRRWRRHPEMGVEGLWVDVYHGGVSVAPRDMHYRLDRVTVATEYIGPPAPALPSWVPAPGGATTLTTTNGRLANNYRDVVNFYHSPFYAVKSVSGFNGAFLNPFWGDYGALLFWGGGHSDTNHNAMISLELGEVCTFKRLCDASPYYGNGAGLSGTPLEDLRAANGIGYVIVDGKASGRNVATGITSGNPYCESLVGDGAPNAPHSWGSGDVLAPADGGATYGSFIQVLSQANTREENYSVNAAHRLDFATLAHGLGARSWVRMTDNWDQTIPTGSVPMHSALVPAQRRVYTFGRASIRQIRWFDLDTLTYTTGTGEGFTLDQASAPGGNGGGIVFHVPERNLLICCYGWPTLVVQWMNVAPGVTQPTRGGTATLSTPINVQTYFSSACWCPDSSRIIVGGLTSADQVAEIAIPATLTDPWPSEVVATPAGVIPFPLGDTGTPSIYKRWSYNPRIKSIAFMQRALLSGSDTVYVYRPRGT